MGKPLKIERIEDMSRLSWLEHVITEASLMTRSIRLHSILMNWMCFPLQVWGGFVPPAKNRGVWGAAPPSPNRIFLEDFSIFTPHPFHASPFPSGRPGANHAA